MERSDVITFKGQPLTLIGDEIKPGDDAPGFKLLDSDLNEVSLNDFSGKIKLLASVPSLDTPVCDLQIKRFNDEAVNLSKDIVVLFISMDLPFAQKRFCQTYEIKRVKTYSDHREASFGKAYGVLIKELRLLSRAVFVVNKENKVTYSQYVKEISSPPDYDNALEALGSVATE
ncbi:MAG: thiol peroxidase [Candidatus Omnitrophica bacterium]|nr:thiol peroxidase [Candidatus Omnitrophota bacterium]